MNLLVRLEKLSIRGFGNRFRRRPQFSENIFRDHEKVRHLHIMNTDGYFAVQTGQPKANYKSLSTEEKQNWMTKRNKNVEEEFLKFFEKYKIENGVKLHRGNYSEDGTFRNIDEHVSKFEEEFTKRDHYFLKELGKFLFIR